MKTLRQIFHESIISRVAEKGDANIAAEIENLIKSGKHVEAYILYHKAMKKIRGGARKIKWKDDNYGKLVYSPTANYPKKH
jgi:hypothetical protein